MTLPNLLQRFEIHKSLQRRDHCLYPARNGRSKTGGGGGHHHLPTLLGLIDAFLEVGKSSLRKEGILSLGILPPVRG